MVDDAILKRYVDESSMKMSDVSKNQIYKNLQTLFNLSSAEIKDMTRQDFIDIFSQQRILAMQTFHSYKSKMIDFLIWMSEEGYCTQEPLFALKGVRFEDISRSGYYDMYYFSDYDDLFHSMEITFEGRGGDFDTFKVAATLVWAGIQLEYAVDLLKKDFDDETGTIVHPKTKEIITFQPIAAEMIREYKNASQYETNKFNGMVLQYKSSPYLLRTYRSGHLNKHGISHYSVVVNQLNQDADKKYQWISIYQSGLYYRMYQYEQEHGEIGRMNFDVLEKFFNAGSDKELKRKYAYGYKYDEYCEFRDYIYT